MAVRGIKHKGKREILRASLRRMSKQTSRAVQITSWICPSHLKRSSSPQYVLRQSSDPALLLWCLSVLCSFVGYTCAERWETPTGPRDRLDGLPRANALGRCCPGTKAPRHDIDAVERPKTTSHPVNHQRRTAQYRCSCRHRCLIDDLSRGAFLDFDPRHRQDR